MQYLTLIFLVEHLAHRVLLELMVHLVHKVPQDKEVLTILLE